MVEGMNLSSHGSHGGIDWIGGPDDYSLYHNYTDPVLYDVLRDGSYAGGVVIFYTLVVTVGVSGNLLVLLTLYANNQTTTATDVFIASLAAVDILVCALDLPVSLHYQLTDNWRFGVVMCHVVPPLMAIVAYASSITLSLIAIDRYRLIVYPLKPRMTPRCAGWMVAGSYALSVLMASPISVFAQYITLSHTDLQLDRVYCLEYWPNVASRRAYAFATFLLHFVIPLTVMTVLYVLVFRKLRKRFLKKNRSGNTSKSEETGPDQKNKNKNKGSRTTKMLVAVVLVFALSWAPYHVFIMIAETSYDHVKGKYFKFIDILLRGVAVSSACINPFLYGWFNENYRTSFYCLCSRLCFHRRDIRSSQQHHRAGVPPEGEGRPIAEGGISKLATPRTQNTGIFSRFKDSVRNTSLRFSEWKKTTQDNRPQRSPHHRHASYNSAFDGREDAEGEQLSLGATGCGGCTPVFGKPSNVSQSRCETYEPSDSVFAYPEPGDATLPSYQNDEGPKPDYGGDTASQDTLELIDDITEERDVPQATENTPLKQKLGR